MGGGGFDGREGELNNCARAGERFGWLAVNRVGSRLRRHSRYSIIGLAIDCAAVSVLSTCQIVLSMAGVKAGAWVVDQVGVPSAKNFVQASNVLASARCQDKFLGGRGLQGLHPKQQGARQNQWEQPNRPGSCRLMRESIHVHRTTHRRGMRTCTLMVDGNQESDGFDRIFPPEQLSGLCAAWRFCPHQRSRQPFRPTQTTDSSSSHRELYPDNE